MNPKKDEKLKAESKTVDIAPAQVVKVPAEPVKVTVVEEKTSEPVLSKAVLAEQAAGRAVLAKLKQT
jgi:hypothetical protein